MRTQSVACLTLFALLLTIQVIGQDTLLARKLKPYGRHWVTDAGHVELIGSASQVGFRFKGKQCRVLAYITNAEGHNYLQYELDGVYQKRVRLDGNSKEPITI